jgi:hypothetical protein
MNKIIKVNSKFPDKINTENKIMKLSILRINKNKLKQLRTNRKNFSGWDLRYSDFSGSNFSGSNFRGSDLRYSDLSGSNFSGSDLSGSDLSGSDLRYSDFSGSNFRGSDLKFSDLRYSDLRYSDLRYSSLNHYYISAGTRNDSALWIPELNKIYAGCFIGTLIEFVNKIKRDNIPEQLFYIDLLKIYIKLEKNKRK